MNTDVVQQQVFIIINDQINPIELNFDDDGFGPTFFFAWNQQSKPTHLMIGDFVFYGHYANQYTKHTFFSIKTNRFFFLLL